MVKRTVARQYGQNVRTKVAEDARWPSRDALSITRIENVFISYGRPSATLIQIKRLCDSVHLVNFFFRVQYEDEGCGD